MNTADVAIVIPVYNRRSIVLETLDSVARQSIPPRRLIVVDDGSTDGTADSVRGWLARANLPTRTLLRTQPAAGVSAARNHGLRWCGDSRFVAFLDSDDLWPVDFLERTTGLLERRPEAIAVSADRLTVDDAKLRRRRERVAGIAENATRWLFTRHAGVASCTLFRADAVASQKGFDETLSTGEDAELFLRLSLLGPWLHSPGAPVTFRKRTARHGDEANVSRFHPANNLIWAQVYEQFIRGRDPTHLLSARDIRVQLSRRWYRAGRQLAAGGRQDEALACFRRSCAWRSWNKAWLQRAIARLAVGRFRHQGLSAR